MAWINRPLGVACTAALIVVAGIQQAPAANLFDAIASIFGGNPAPSYEQPEPARQYFRYEDLAPADQEFRPRREYRPREVRERVERPRQPTNVAIDPVKVPDWYLQDTTLGRGDIVVLTNGVFVFDGGRAPHLPEDFVPLERSRLSAADRAKVAAMTGYRPTQVAAATRAKTAAVDLPADVSGATSR